MMSRQGIVRSTGSIGVNQIMGRGMQVILEPYDVPERGTFQIQEIVTICVSADEARRQVDHWLLHEVNSQMAPMHQP
jgi:hypothetical protein